MDTGRGYHSAILLVVDWQETPANAISMSVALSKLYLTPLKRVATRAMLFLVPSSKKFISFSFLH